MWLERKRTLNHFWDKWQADYLATLSIDKKWLGDDTKIRLTLVAELVSVRLTGHILEALLPQGELKE